MPRKDPEKNKKYMAEYYLCNKHRINAVNAEYRKKHKAELDAANALWKQTHPHIIRANKRTLTARFGMLCKGAKIRDLSVGFDKETYATLVAGRACHYCGGSLPETGGGLDRKNSSVGYSVENCVPCCRNCNSIRGADLISYKEMLEVAKLLRKLRTKTDAGDDSEEYF